MDQPSEGNAPQGIQYKTFINKAEHDIELIGVGLVKAGEKVRTHVDVLHKDFEQVIDELKATEPALANEAANAEQVAPPAEPPTPPAEPTPPAAEPPAPEVPPQPSSQPEEGAQA